MARILVQTDDGTTLMDELHVSSIRVDSKTDAMNLLERLSWAIREAEDRLPDRGRQPRPWRRRSSPSMRNAAVMSGVGRTFD
jgi:hypothetical protein